MAKAPLVRAAADADLDAITSIYRHHVLTGTASFEIDAPDVAEMGRRRASVMSSNLPYLVAEKEGHIAGYAYAGFYHARRAYRFTVEDSIYVHPDMQQQGIGDALLSSLIAACRQRGCRQIVAIIGDSGNVGSIRLHEKHGFGHSGVLRSVGFKFERWLDTVFMQLSLNSSAECPSINESC